MDVCYRWFSKQPPPRGAFGIIEKRFFWVFVSGFCRSRVRWFAPYGAFGLKKTTKGVFWLAVVTAQRCVWLTDLQDKGAFGCAEKPKGVFGITKLPSRMRLEKQETPKGCDWIVRHRKPQKGCSGESKPQKRVFVVVWLVSRKP
ncbi:hypothetical protein Tco_0167722 [Tanacetum coccineum]